MTYDFDKPVERRGTDSIKWRQFEDDVIPLWVADMDFVSPEPVITALQDRVAHGVFGYARPSRDLVGAIQDRLKKLYAWEVPEEHLVFLPGVVTGLNFSFQLYADPGDEVLVQSPIYSHFVTDPVVRGRVAKDQPLAKKGDTYEIDFDAFEKAITPRTKMFALCNPHNPVGRAFRKDELEQLAEICLRHGLLICSDEIHCDILYPGHRHTPIATLSEEVAEQTITFMSPSKTFNLAGLKSSFAIIGDPALREAWMKGSQGLIPHVNIMGLTAAQAAFTHGQDWLDQCLLYLDGNRRFLEECVHEKLPSLRMTKMEATYLAWLDCRQSGIPDNAFDFFLRESRVALNDGNECGTGGKGFVRLNFACSRMILVEALDRMARALERL
jgi:cysteine-S-conjugate beta-lyase